MSPRRRGISGLRSGTLRAPLDDALGARSRVAVLRVLAALPAPLSQRELARRAGVQVRSAQQAIEVLVALGLVRRTIGGRDHLVEFNRHHHLFPTVAALFEAEADRFRAVREALHTWANARGLAGTIQSLAIFGSAARAEDSSASDLDVLALTASGRGRADLDAAFETVSADLRERQGVQARLLTYSVSQARTMLRRRQPPIAEAMRDAIVLIGPPLRELLT